ncbi:hypothetical protein MPTK1_4g09610 [Marchantia polymorpha subsp. ruderalis]|uniref:Uncharacterized protein n=2 Tax=Marchantia polymorpha TaxID=3197 RepID=A0AAF6B860_MARPO|nr:hypothetical protein MARPO_0132s0004 [Marchantia polymorpha]BBN08194.1 hypothetical protein Mp_4g09610 [Marchantia polymorpha subsp. ruderalis]|eukprot:PTQ29924.1 hypothetical protein MARPO_0132s0004 [Marchantia polymorpha]
MRHTLTTSFHLVSYRRRRGRRLYYLGVNIAPGVYFPPPLSRLAVVPIFKGKGESLFLFGNSSKLRRAFFSWADLPFCCFPGRMSRV